MRVRSRTWVVALAVFVGCGSKGGGSFGGMSVAPTTSGVAPTSSSGTVAPVATAAAAPEIVPLILIHGHTGSPKDFGPYFERYAQGFVQVRSLYAAEADQLKPGDLPCACIVAAGYYKDSATGVLYDLVNGVGTGSLGDCPDARDDGNQGLYPISYVARLARIVEGVRRATGSDRVDFACHSMGNLVGRAYARWYSQGAASGTSKVRRIFCIAGPHRGINALEACVDGLDNGGNKAFMLMGEDAEMCYELKAWQGDSYIDWLNQDWDQTCQTLGIRYGGITGTGAFGPQGPPPPPAPPPGAPSPSPSPAPPPPPAPAPSGPFGISLSGPFAAVFQALQGINFQTLPQAFPYTLIFFPNLFGELTEALGPSDGTVRVESSRMDKAPFLGHDFFAEVECRHSDEWNPEQAMHASTFTTELARQYLLQPTLATTGIVTSSAVRLVDAPGKASWIAIETSVANGPLVSAQLVEEKVDATGNVIGNAWGYGVPVPEGDQRAFIEVPKGGGTRAYHLVLYATSGAVSKQDVTFTLTDGALDVAPVTTLVSTTTTLGSLGPSVSATFGSNTQDPSLRFSFRFDEGPWTPWASGATFTTPQLGPGEHRLDARAQHAANGAALVADDARGASIGIFVDTVGAVTIRK